MTANKTTLSKRKSQAQKKEPSAEARLPHERDEASDSQEASAPQREVGQQAHDDVEAGRVDTGSAPVTDSTYRRLK